MIEIGSGKWLYVRLGWSRKYLGHIFEIGRSNGWRSIWFLTYRFMKPDGAYGWRIGVRPAHFITGQK